MDYVSVQTEQTQNRLLLEEQSDQGLILLAIAKHPRQKNQLAQFLWNFGAN